MNTPAHLIVSLAALTGGDGRAHARPILLGALLPDLPMFGFYLWQRLYIGLPEMQIWREAYFRASWQDFFDVFNSIPLALLALGLAVAARKRAAVYFFASVLIHCAIDLAVHREDAHRHFWPLAHWRFESPVSYWDPRHYGALGAGLEVALALAGAWLLWPRFRGPAARSAIALACALYVVGYAAFYWPGLLDVEFGTAGG